MSAITGLFHEIGWFFGLIGIIVFLLTLLCIIACNHRSGQNGREREEEDFRKWLETRNQEEGKGN